MSEFMIFCLGDGRTGLKGEGYQKNYRVFNKDVSEKEYEETQKKLDEADIKILLTEWIKQDDGGYLKKYSYEDAWKNWLKDSTEEQRKTILDIPQFDEKIFKEITGLTKKDLEKNNNGKQKQKLLDKADELIKKAEELREEAKKI